MYVFLLSELDYVRLCMCMMSECFCLSEWVCQCDWIYKYMCVSVLVWLCVCAWVIERKCVWVSQWLNECVPVSKAVWVRQPFFIVCACVWMSDFLFMFKKLFCVRKRIDCACELVSERLCEWLRVWAWVTVVWVCVSYVTEKVSVFSWCLWCVVFEVCVLVLGLSV